MAAQLVNRAITRQHQGDSQENPIIVRSNRDYLITVGLEGVYTSYVTANITAHAVKLTTVMVPLLDEGQDRVVLRWNHKADLDLWIDAVFGTGIQEFVGWDTPYVIDTATTIELYVDQFHGIAPDGGPETVSFNDVGIGTFKVWVNLYGDDPSEVFTPSLVQEAPAAVDIYSWRYLDDDGEERSGHVTTEVQRKEDVPAGGAMWWNVGQIIAPSLSGTGRLQWQSCLTECYSNIAPYEI